MPAKEKRPSVKAPWPPKDSWAVHQVGLFGRDNWWKLGASHGRDNPWDIIIFNFQTEDPREVNWYLREYIGCKHTKGSNYIFFDADPGEVHMPPPTWIPPKTFRKGSSRTDYNKKIGDRVASMIRRNANSFPTIKMGKFKLNSSHMIDVAKAIEKGKILCLVRPGIGLSGAIAAYELGSNVMLFSKEPNAGAMDDIASVVHEAAHASFDIRKAGEVHVSSMEIIAHAVEYCMRAKRFRSRVKTRLEKGFEVEKDYDLLRFGWIVMADPTLKTTLDLDALAAETSNRPDPFNKYLDLHLYSDLYDVVKRRYKTRLGPGMKIIKGSWGDKVDCDGL